MGSLKVVPKLIQNSLYSFHAEQCFAHVCFEAEYRIKFSKSLESADISAGIKRSVLINLTMLGFTLSQYFELLKAGLS